MDGACPLDRAAGQPEGARGARPGPADRRPPGRQSAREEGRAVMTMSTSSITVTTANGGAATGAASGSVTVS